MRMEIKGGILLDTFNGAQATNMDKGLLQFKDNRWILRQGGEEGVVMFGARVGREAMEEYDKGDTQHLGISYERIENFISDREDTITLWTDGMTLYLDDGRDQVKMATLHPDNIKGANINIPGVTHEISFEADMSFVIDFINKVDGVVGSDWFLICCRKDGVYLFSEHDNSMLDRHYEWDEFEDVSIDWSVNNIHEGGGVKPKEAKEIDTLLANEFIKSLADLGDEATFYFGNHVPCRVVWRPRDGVAMSYFVAPRLGDDFARMRPPEDIFD